MNSLSSTSVVDLHKKFINRNCTVERDFKMSRRYTWIWGVFCIVAAMFATRMGSLIEAVNILGSLFYGVILGIFLVAFFLKRVGGQAVFISAVISEIFILLLFALNEFNVIGLEFLWLNVIGALSVMGLALVIELFIKKRPPDQASA